MDKKRIPNFDTLSTLLDRLAIENVKLAHFENAMEHDNLTNEERSEFQAKINVQREIIEALKKETATFMRKAFLTGRYEFVKEERTFK